jgi:hypothetical protein
MVKIVALLRQEMVGKKSTQDRTSSARGLWLLDSESVDNLVTIQLFLCSLLEGQSSTTLRSR